MSDSVSLIPLANPENFDFDGYEANREAQFLTIAHGKTPAERNFAWYDIGGVDKVRLQYAEKNTGTEADFESADVKIVEGTCGPMAIME